MQFRWYFVSMGATVALVLGVLLAFGQDFCIPVEQMPCTSFLPIEGQMVQAAPPDTSAPVPEQAPAPAPVTPTSTVPAGTGGTVPANGNKDEYSLAFEISPDFSKYGFNGTGGAGTNPTITVHSGDTVTIHLSNPSKSFHAFGVVVDPANPSAVLWNSAFKTPDNPMKPGEKGDSTFVAGTPGLYHYICTVPGHAELGMDGNLIVEK